MKLPLRLRLPAVRWAAKLMAKRLPDEVIGSREAPYLRRWFVLPKNPLCNIYLHNFRRSDDERALHDHPWCSLSLLLAGSYVEHTARGVRQRAKGALVLRRARTAHRIELDAGEAWTLFVTGPRVRQWGFHCPQGWRHWRAYTADNGTELGVGCD